MLKFNVEGMTYGHCAQTVIGRRGDARGGTCRCGLKAVEVAVEVGADKAAIRQAIEDAECDVRDAA